MGGKYENDSACGRRAHHNVDVLLAKKGWKVGDLLAMMGVENSATYYAWFRNKRGPTDAQLHKLAEALDVQIQDLMREVDA